MSYLTHPRPPEPLVSKNPYLQQRYSPQPIVTFAEIKTKLPVPILPEQPEWVALYWVAWEKIWSQLSCPSPENGFVANYLRTAKNENMVMWDSAFMAQFGLYGRCAFDFMGTLDNFYARQHNDGFICRAINMKTGKDFFYPFDPNSTGPNILAWAEWRYFRVTGDDSRLANVFWPLVAYHRWCQQNRTWPNGLYWATRLSSALENQPRVPDSHTHHRHWTWIDATLQAALSCLVLGHMATLLDQEAIAVELTDEHRCLVDLTNKHLWHEAAGFYQDVDPHGRYSPVKSIAAYWALLDKEMVPKKRLDPFLRHLREAWAFKLPHPIPSQSADSEGYNADTGNAWRGGVWPATNFMVLKGLRRLEQNALAHAIAMNHMAQVADVFQQTGSFWENYAPEKTAPGEPAKQNFLGATALTPISILLEDVIGLSVDWPHRRVSWDRRLNTEQAYGVRHYPLGPGGTLDLLGTNAQLTLTTDVPFTLSIRDATQSLQTAVPTGTTVINLE